MQVTIDIPAKAICDVFITAVEGGSSFWCDTMIFTKGGWPADYRKFETFEGNDWHVKVIPAETPEDDSPYEITSVKLAAAFSALPSRLAALMDGSYDAEDADCFVQQAAFADIVFG
jgi:hypothetical protein